MKRFRHYFSMLLSLMIACNCFAGSSPLLTGISLLPNPQADFCPGSDMDVAFFVEGGDANAGNIFTVQLSDATGSFANPVNIGSITSISSSSFIATIPLGTAAGTGYRIRVVSSSPVITSSDNGNDIIINQVPTVTVSGFGSPAGPLGSFCPNAGMFLSTSGTGVVTNYQWKFNGTNINGATQSTYTGMLTGDYSVVVTNAAGCTKESAIFHADALLDVIGQVSGNSSLCPGGTVMLTGNTFTGNWYFNGNGLQGSNALSVTVPGDYQWEPHTLSGCTGTISPVFTVTTLSASFTGLASHYSVNDAPATLVGNHPGGTFSGPGISVNAFVPSLAGVGGPYTITYTYHMLGDPNNPAGCTATSTMQTSVTLDCTPPSAQITAAGPTTFCESLGLLMTANTGIGLSYQWKKDNVDIIGATQFSYATTVSGDYSVLITNADGCSQESNTITATAISVGQGQITSVAGNILCPNGSLVLSGSASAFGSWYINGSEIPNSLTNILGVSVPGDYQWWPHSVSGCAGTISPVFTVISTVSFTGLESSYSSNAPAVALVGNPAGGTFSGSGVSGNLFDPSVAGIGGPYTITYSYIVPASPNNPSGCTLSSTQQTTVTSGCIPPNAVITADGPTTFCSNDSVTLHANTGTGFSYQWNLGGVGVGTNSASFVAHVSGDYWVQIINADGCSASSNIIHVTSVPLPVATITPAGPTTFCGNSNVTLNASTGAGYTYQWQVGTVNITGATSSSFIASVSGSYNVVVTNANGCSTISSAVIVNSNVLPAVSFTGLANIYAPTAPAATLTGNPAGGTFSGPGISGNTFNPATAGVGGPYTITYTYTNGNGCTNTSTHQTIVGSVCPVPSIPGSISTTNDGTLVCPGEVKTYTISPVPGATSYTWIAPPGADIISGQGTVSAMISYNAGFTAGDSLRVTADNSCGSSITRARKINRKSPPSSPVAIAGPTTGICNITGVGYSVVPQPGNSFTWSWNTGGASIASGQGTETVTSDFTTAFISGKISVTTSNACGTSSPRNLIVNAKPGAPGTITGIAGVCANQQAVAYSISPVVNASSYIWYAPTGAHINDGVTTSIGSSLATNATNVQVNFGTTGGLVRVKGVNACTVGSVTSLPVSIVCKNGLPATGIAGRHSVDIYPNPSNGQFRIMLGNVQKMESVKIEIMNQFGQLVYQGSQACNNGMIDIDLTSKVTNGIYMVSCVVNGEKRVSKLMISK